MAISQSTLPVHTSEPDFIQRHNISDDELSMLCEGRKDLVLEFLWIAIGVFVGSMPAALVAMAKYGSESVEGKMPLDDLIQIVLFWASLIATIILSIVALRRSNRAKDLQSKIRDRGGEGPA